MERKKGSRNIVFIVSVIVLILIFISVFVNRASIGRFFKDVKSEFNNGLERTVNVYDVNGDIIKTYKGKFDIEWEDDRIKFDDEKGKRHIIYFKTGTVIVDED